MKKLTPLIVAIILATSAHIGYAKEPGEFTAEFFTMMEAGKISDAYDQLFIGSQIPAQKPQAVDMLKKLWCQILNSELHSSLFTIQDLTPIFDESYKHRKFRYPDAESQLYNPHR